MKITEKISFDDYWNDKRYQNKKPVLNGSFKQFFGDNIYHKEGETWIQENSHHSLPDGKPNISNLERDTSSEYVLLSNHFYYWGKNAIKIPDILKVVYENIGIGHISDRISIKTRNEFISWLIDEISFKPGYHGDPLLFEDIERYPGD